MVADFLSRSMRHVEGSYKFIRLESTPRWFRRMTGAVRNKDSRPLFFISGEAMLLPADTAVVSP